MPSIRSIFPCLNKKESKEIEAEQAPAAEPEPQAEAAPAPKGLKFDESTKSETEPQSDHDDVENAGKVHKIWIMRHDSCPYEKGRNPQVFNMLLPVQFSHHFSDNFSRDTFPDIIQPI